MTVNVDTLIKKYGRDVHIFCSAGRQIQSTRCILTPLRYKNKMYLEGIPTDIGIDDSGYYLLIAPSSAFVEKTGDKGYLCDNEKKYHIDRYEKVFFGENVLYFWAVLKEMKKGDYPLYNHFTQRR